MRHLDPAAVDNTAFIDPGASPRPSRAAWPQERWALAGSDMNICNHSHAGAIPHIPGLPGLVGLGWQWLGALVKFPAPSASTGRRKLGRSVLFPRKHALCKQAQHPGMGSPGLPASIRGMQLRTDTTHSPRELTGRAPIPPPVLPLSLGKAGVLLPPGTVGVLAGPQGEQPAVLLWGHCK